MKRMTWPLCAVAALVIAACGGGEENANAAGTASVKASKSGDASAEEVAKEMRGKVKCPAKVSQPAGGPVADVVGVRPGMPWAEAENVILCDHKMLVVTENASRGFNIETYGQHIRQGFDAKFADARVTKSSREIMKDMADEALRRSGNAREIPLEPGQMRWYVTTMGLAGQERVLAVAREEYFADAELPTVASVKEALVAKYGPPTQAQENGPHTIIFWQYDPSGRPLAQSDYRALNCRFSVSPDVGISLSEDCGLAIGAQVRAAQTNPDLAHSLAVTSQNGAQGYALLMRTQDALRQADEARRASEVNAASKNAAKPKL